MVINQAPNNQQVRQTFLDGKGGRGERELLCAPNQTREDLALEGECSFLPS